MKGTTVKILLWMARGISSHNEGQPLQRHDVGPRMTFLVRETKRSRRSADQREGIRKGQKVALALDHRDILGLDLVEHKKPRGGLYTECKT